MRRVTAAPTQLRPLAIGEVLDVALKIVWRNAGTLIRVVVFVVLPVQILSALLAASVSPDSLNSDNSFSFQTQTSSTVSSSDLRAFVGYAVAIGVLGFLSATLSSAACFRAIASAYLGERTDWRSSLGYALRHLHSIILVTLLAALATVGGLIVFVLPGIYFGVAFSLAVPVLLTEGLRGRRALGRSKALVKGYWWRVFGVVVLGYILSGILSGAIEAAVVGLTSISRGDSSITAIVVNVIAGTVSKLVTTPFVAGVIIVIYFDLRVRKEAFDLQLLAEQIGVEPAADAFEGRYSPVPPQDLSGDEPPFWPPPPGWKPGGAVAFEARPEPASSHDRSADEPPFWPPPPGWKPGGGDGQ
jgi:hypothetical protein